MKPKPAASSPDTAPASIFSNEAVKFQDAIDLKESLRSVNKAAVFVNLDETAKSYLSPEQAESDVLKVLAGSKFKTSELNDGTLPILYFNVQCTGVTSASVSQVATGFTVRVLLIQAVPLTRAIYFEV